MLDSLGQENWDFCKIKSSRLLTYVSYVVGPYMLRIKFEENYKVIFSEKIIFLPQFGRELQGFDHTKKILRRHWAELLVLSSQLLARRGKIHG